MTDRQKAICRQRQTIAHLRPHFAHVVTFRVEWLFNRHRLHFLVQRFVVVASLVAADNVSDKLLNKIKDFVDFKEKKK